MIHRRALARRTIASVAVAPAAMAQSWKSEYPELVLPSCPPKMHRAW